MTLTHPGGKASVEEEDSENITAVPQVLDELARACVCVRV